MSYWSPLILRRAQDDIAQDDIAQDDIAQDDIAQGDKGVKGLSPVSGAGLELTHPFLKIIPYSQIEFMSRVFRFHNGSIQ